MKKSGVAIIAEDKRGRFLIHHRDGRAPSMPNEWCLVGGSVEEKESPIEAARRELKEETNLDIEKLELFEKFNRVDKDMEVYIYYARFEGGHNDIILGEGRELKFFTVSEAIDLIDSIRHPNQYLMSLRKFILKK